MGVYPSVPALVSIVSDGTIGPLELYRRATDQGVELLANDSVAAHHFLRHRFIRQRPLNELSLITGIELPTTSGWFIKATLKAPTRLSVIT